jgi:transposase
MTTDTKSRRSYTEDFKREAVALVTEQGYTVTDAARSLGINSNQLHRWKRLFADEATGTRLSDDEREELKRLRKEVRELRMEKDILKKASQYFAKEMK